MRLMIKAVALVLAFLIAVPAQAQMLGPSWESNISLKQGDLDMIHRIVAEQIHGKAVGATASWRNPEFRQCRQRHARQEVPVSKPAVRAARVHAALDEGAVRPEHYMFNSCLQPDGSWKIS